MILTILCPANPCTILYSSETLIRREHGCQPEYNGRCGDAE